MPRDVSGTYTLPLAPIEPRRIPVVNWVNPTVEDIAAALNNIPGGALAPGSVGTTQLADGSVTNPKLADGSVTGAKVQDNSIPLTKLQGLPGSPGLLANTGSGLAARTITGTANQISVSNGSGAAGDPVLSIPSSPAFGGTVSLLGGQLAFPSTQLPSANPNTLDDYEEGTFTPTLTFATPGDLSTAYSSRYGFYTKIGNIVFVTMRVTATTFTYTTAAGGLLILGLPFPVSTPTPLSMSFFTGFGNLTGYVVNALNDSNGVNFYACGVDSSGALFISAGASIPSGSAKDFIISGSYLTT